MSKLLLLLLEMSQIGGSMSSHYYVNRCKAAYDLWIWQPLSSDQRHIADAEIPIGENRFRHLLLWQQSLNCMLVSWDSRSGRMLLQFNCVAGVNATRIAATYQNGSLLSGE